MKDDPFTRVTAGKHPVVLHAAKGRFPNEGLCGRVLDPTPVTPKGRVKCEACQIALKNLRSNNGLP